MIDMKLDEVFDENYYDFLQDEMRRKVYDPYEDDPATDTEMHMGDFIVSAYETGNIPYKEALRRLKEISGDNFEFHFWKTELMIAAEEKGDL